MWAVSGPWPGSTGEGGALGGPWGGTAELGAEGGWRTSDEEVGKCPGCPRGKVGGLGSRDTKEPQRRPVFLCAGQRREMPVPGPWQDMMRMLSVFLRATGSD